MYVKGESRRGRSKMIWLDMIESDMKGDEDAVDRVKWNLRTSFTAPK